jgi:hypothetical protein
VGRGALGRRGRRERERGDDNREEPHVLCRR